MQISPDHIELIREQRLRSPIKQMYHSVLGYIRHNEIMNREGGNSHIYSTSSASRIKSGFPAAQMSYKFPLYILFCAAITIRVWFLGFFSGCAQSSHTGE